MKYLVFVKLTGEVADAYEHGRMPTEGEIDEMMKFNQELVDAGVVLDGQGLQPTPKGIRVEFPKGKATVSDGPFPETKELIGGYWIWQVGSRDEAIDWASKCPMAEGDVLEMRQIFEMDDFGDTLSEKNRELTEQMTRKAGS